MMKNSQKDVCDVTIRNEKKERKIEKMNEKYLIQ